MSLRMHRRVGFTMIELLMVVVLMAVVFLIAIPQLTLLSDSASLRAGRQQFIAAFAAARSAALQKGKDATLFIEGNKARVSVLTGLAATPTTVFGPIDLERSGVTIAAASGALTTVTYGGRGLLKTRPAGTMRYFLRHGNVADTVCISQDGVILPKGCQL